jgi:hypothetical protein
MSGSSDKLADVASEPIVVSNGRATVRQRCLQLALSSPRYRRSGPFALLSDASNSSALTLPPWASGPLPGPARPRRGALPYGIGWGVVLERACYEGGDEHSVQSTF